MAEIALDNLASGRVETPATRSHAVRGLGSGDRGWIVREKASDEAPGPAAHADRPAGTSVAPDLTFDPGLPVAFVGFDRGDDGIARTSGRAA